MHQYPMLLFVSESSEERATKNMGYNVIWHTPEQNTRELEAVLISKHGVQKSFKLEVRGQKQEDDPNSVSD